MSAADPRLTASTRARNIDLTVRRPGNPTAADIVRRTPCVGLVAPPFRPTTG
jgi:hypothetical protein